MVISGLDTTSAVEFSDSSALMTTCNMIGSGSWPLGLSSSPTAREGGLTIPIGSGSGTGIMGSAVGVVRNDPGSTVEF